MVDDRRAFIANACKNRSIVHLGCADWPFTAQGLWNDTLLHVILAKVSKRVLGIDQSDEGLSLLRASGFEDLIKWDVEKLGELKIERPVDIIVAGEILEHLANPGLCVQSISQFMRSHGGTLVISVPNAFCLRALVPFMFRRIEMVHADHTAYYSPTTLSELLRRYGFKIRELYAYSDLKSTSSYVKRSLKRIANATLLHAFPQVSEGIIAVADLSDEHTPTQLG